MCQNKSTLFYKKNFTAKKTFNAFLLDSVAQHNIGANPNSGIYADWCRLWGDEAQHDKLVFFFFVLRIVSRAIYQWQES